MKMMKKKYALTVHINYEWYHMLVGVGGSQAFYGDVLPDSQWYGVLSLREIYTQRPSS